MISFVFIAHALDLWLSLTERCRISRKNLVISYRFDRLLFSPLFRPRI